MNGIVPSQYMLSVSATFLAAADYRTVRSIAHHRTSLRPRSLRATAGYQVLTYSGLS